ncbi:MAG: T9SS type A sorting domain-containing protein [Bacteroidales bacterium]|nr:T9SS type A sorting domain-containing protein [Bacteroidales bacterium]
MRKFFLILTAILTAAIATAQDYIIEIPTAMAGDVARLSRAVSIDGIRDGVITAYANESELMTLRTILPQYAYNVRNVKSLSKSAEFIKMAQSIEEMQDWEHYPTYETYVAMMKDFAAKHPDLAQLVDIGASAAGRQILAVRITADGDTLARPRVFLTSTMHGDETCGYVLMLRLIDFLLNNYGTHPEATRIVNNIVLYINPLANPDGTYYGGNGTVAESRRYNANNVDLNRNFPEAGALTKNTQNLEPETIAMMNFAKSRHFTLSANMHGGDEVLNYPWDSFEESEMGLADKDWFEDICQKYIDTLRTFAPNGMKTVNEQGYVFGSVWYKVAGGRQDWMLYSERCREVTIELSTIKTLRCDLLENYWQRHRDGLLLYVCNALQGIRGQAVDFNGNPIKAQIYLDGHDYNYSSIFCDAEGQYVRPTLADKTYNVCAVADGYETQCQEVVTKKDQLVVADFTMAEGVSEYVAITPEKKSPSKLQTTVHQGIIEIKSTQIIDRVEIADVLGRRVGSYNPKTDTFKCQAYNLSDGIYVIRVQTGGVVASSKITITK